jgi:adenylosuccinate synthase
MSTTAVIGAQWGDEGKGKIVDLLSEHADIVARYQGGPNAGHTVVIKNEELVLHQIPSGILWPHTTCVIGNGVVIDLRVLLEEMEMVKKRGFKVEGRLFISDRAHLILPYHRLLDEAREQSQGENKIGTTGRGIGPAYMDKVGRIGIRTCELLEADDLSERVKQVVSEHNKVLRSVYQRDPVSTEEVISLCLKYAEILKDTIIDTSVVLDEAIRAGKSILLEGAQGTMLDVDFGTYPFVTSSNPAAGGACTGLGIGPNKIDEIIAVVKAYTTRVGMGPFPTEFNPEFSEKVRQLGVEFGATTGRPRRCGWFDAVVVNHAVRVNGLTSLVITKLDVLDTLEEIKICTGYRYKGEILPHYPAGLKAQLEAEPVYETHPGWLVSTTTAAEWEQLPTNAQRYIARISELTHTPIFMISVGPNRSQTITANLKIARA